jgi:Dihydroxyacetone kinase family
VDAVAVIGAYLLGAVPFSQIVSMRVVGTGARPDGAQVGDTVAVAGGDDTWRCHVHTDDVDGALAAAHEAGTVTDIEITDLAGQLGGRQ